MYVTSVFHLCDKTPYANNRKEERFPWGHGGGEDETVSVVQSVSAGSVWPSASCCAWGSEAGGEDWNWG